MFLYSWVPCMQCACAIWPCVPYPPLQHLFTLSHKGHNFQLTLLNVKCAFRFYIQIMSETIFILGRTEWDVIKNVCWSSCKVPVIFVRSLWDLIFLDKVSKNLQISSFINVRPVGAELFHPDRRTEGRTDRQTDRQTNDEANSRFAQFCEHA